MHQAFSSSLNIITIQKKAAIKAFSPTDFGAKPNRKAFKVEINLIVRNPIYIISLLSFIVFALQSNPGFSLLTTFLYNLLSFLSGASDWFGKPMVELDNVPLDVFLINTAGLYKPQSLRLVYLCLPQGCHTVSHV